MIRHQIPTTARPARNLRWLAAGFFCALLALLGLSQGGFAIAQGAQPFVTFTNPANNATNVLRDVFVTADVSVPNGGIDPATLTGQTVYLVRTSDSTQVPAVLNTSGGGDVIVLRPTALLAANTNYTFVVSSGLKDITGVGFVPYSMSFTTGTGTNTTSSSESFTKIALASAPAKAYTGVTIGPDNKLYAGTVTGEILRWAINADGTLGAAQSITSLQTANGGNRLLVGLRFDPAATAGNLILWVSHSAFVFSNGPDWAGKITRLSGANLETVQDYVVDLPRSTRDHITNQIDFGPDGALYFTQGSNSAMGAPDNAWNNRPERLLSAAVLRLNVASVTAPPLSVKTEEGGTYDPFAPNAPLTIYASGTRNAYDLVWHQNGFLYVPTNGSASGGATPSTPSPFAPPYSPRLDQQANGAYTGPQVPGIASVGQTMNDYLFRVVPNGYYGHPNPKRHEYVLNGGNPTSGTDPAQVNQYPVGTQPDRNWRGAAFDFGQHYSPDGIIEYKSNTFGGSLLGKLLVVRYSGGDDILVLTPGATGDIIRSQAGTLGMTGFNDPVDLCENPANGFLYVAEYGGQKITALRPVTASPASSLSAIAVSSTRIDLSWTDNATNETGFKLERKTGANGTYALVKTLGPNVTSVSDTGLTAGTAYYYRVRSYNETGDSAFSNTADATTLSVYQYTLTPGADAFVRDGSAYQNTNYGADVSLLTKKSTSGYNRWAYFKFDLTGAGAGTITSAKLRVWGRVSSGTSASTPTAVYSVATTTWTEGSITWVNKPASGTTALATKTLTNAAAQYYEWDVTSYARQEKNAARNLVSLALKNTVGSTPVTVLNAKEASSSKPEILVTIER